MNNNNKRKNKQTNKLVLFRIDYKKIDLIWFIISFNLAVAVIVMVYIIRNIINNK